MRKYLKKKKKLNELVMKLQRSWSSGFLARVLGVSCKNLIPNKNSTEFFVGMKFNNYANLPNE